MLLTCKILIDQHYDLYDCQVAWALKLGTTSHWALLEHSLDYSDYKFVKIILVTVLFCIVKVHLSFLATTSCENTC